jgi:hypothetical protein
MKFKKNNYYEKIQSTLRLFSLVVAILWSCQLEAQRSKVINAPAEKIAEKQTTLQTEKLNLNKEQANKLQTLNLKYAEQMQAEMKSLQKNKKEFFAQLKELNEAQNKEVRAILSEEQFRNYIELKKQNRARLKERKLEGYSEIQKKKKKYADVLNLSEKQKVQLKVIKMKYAKKMKELKQNPQFKKGNLKDLADKRDLEVKTILSDEQFENYINLKEEYIKLKTAKM